MIEVCVVEKCVSWRRLMRLLCGGWVLSESVGRLIRLSVEEISELANWQISE